MVQVTIGVKYVVQDGYVSVKRSNYVSRHLGKRGNLIHYLVHNFWRARKQLDPWRDIAHRAAEILGVL